MFSLSEPVTIKRVSLRLYATLRMDWYDPVLAVKTGSNKSVKFEKTVYEHEWSNLEVASRGSGHTTPLSASSHTLPVGNHEFPFEVIIPGSIDESVEGLDGAQVIYKLVAKIERGRFANNLITKKHLRVIRTLGTDALELSQTMCIENTWPNKVEYSVSIPAKAIAIGSSTPINFSFTPLLKGLKIGKAKIHLVEFRTLSATPTLSTNFEKVIAEKAIPPPEDGFDGQDLWTFEEIFNVPSSLSKCTQNCQIGTYINVSHKLRFSVALVNPDGHVSELRASVPINLYISPHVSITSIHHTHSNSVSNGQADESESEDHLFSSSEQQVVIPGHFSHNGLNAPPSYSDHIYDTLWRNIPLSHLNTPVASGTSTPHLQSRRNSNDNHDNSVFGAHDRSALLSNLIALQERQNRDDSESSVPADARNSSHPIIGSPPPSNRLASAATVGSYNSRHHSRVASGTSTPIGSVTPVYALSGLGSPVGSATTATQAGDNFAHIHGTRSPDFQHLSHNPSPLMSPSLSPHAEEIDLALLSKVPSYQTAITCEPSHGGEYTPSYENHSHTDEFLSNRSGPSSPLPASSHHNSRSSSHNNSFSNLNGFFQRHSTSKAASTPGSSTCLSSLSRQIIEAKITEDSSKSPSASINKAMSTNANANSSSVSLSTSPDTLNNNDIINNSSHSSIASSSSSISSSVGGFFRTSSKSQISHILDHSPRPASISNSNRTHSSRSLLDDASKFLHIHK